MSDWHRDWPCCNNTSITQRELKECPFCTRAPASAAGVVTVSDEAAERAIAAYFAVHGGKVPAPSEFMDSMYEPGGEYYRRTGHQVRVRIAIEARVEP
jgi:hypothetical protein